MDPESIMLSEINQAEKNKYRMLSLICENKKTKQSKTKNRHRYRD